MPFQYKEGPFKGQLVPHDDVWSGGANPNADNYGSSYVFAAFAYGPNGECWDDGSGGESRHNNGMAGWQVEEVFPENPSKGDTYTMMVYGGSGTYQAWYEYDGDTWILQGDTIPWQMKR